MLTARILTMRMATVALQRGAFVLSFILGIAAHGSVLAATFGQAPTYNSDVGFALNVSPDKKAFTAVFAGLEVHLEGKLPAPVLMRTFSFVLPVSDAEKGSEIPFFVQGSASFEKGASGRLVFMVNDQTMVVHFSENPKRDDFLRDLKYKVGAAPELRITIIVMVDRDSKSGAGAYLNVSVVDTDVLKHKR
jgi:hypothetical protein